MSERSIYDTFEGFELVEDYYKGFYAIPPAGVRHVGDYVGIMHDGMTTRYCLTDREVRMAVLAALRYEHEKEMERLAELAKSL